MGVRGGLEEVEIFCKGCLMLAFFKEDDIWAQGLRKTAGGDPVWTAEGTSAQGLHVSQRAFAAAFAEGEGGARWTVISRQWTSGHGRPPLRLWKELLGYLTWSAVCKRSAGCGGLTVDYCGTEMERADHPKLRGVPQGSCELSDNPGECEGMLIKVIEQSMATGSAHTQGVNYARLCPP